MKEHIILLSALLSTGMVKAQPPFPGKTEILEAIEGHTTYATNVLLDESGKSRRDHNMAQGKWYPYEEPWHTGQIILGLLGACEIIKSPQALAVARKTGDWWIGLEIKDSPILKGMIGATHDDDIGSDKIVFAIVTNDTHGIFELSRVTGNKKCTQVADNALGWMLEHMYYPEEEVCYDSADSKTGETQKTSSSYKDKRQQVLNDVSRPSMEGSPFKDAYELMKDKRSKDARLLPRSSLIDKQDENGIWIRYVPNHRKVHSSHPRFNLWYVESLLEACEMTRDRKYPEAAARITRTYVKVQEVDGTIFYDNYTGGKLSDKGSVCGSTVTFAGTLWTRSAGYGYGEFVPNYERGLRRIIKDRYTVSHPDPSLWGGVIDTRICMGKGQVWPIQGDVETSFGLHFLVVCYNLKLNK